MDAFGVLFQYCFFVARQICIKYRDKTLQKKTRKETLIKMIMITHLFVWNAYCTLCAVLNNKRAKLKCVEKMRKWWQCSFSTPFRKENVAKLESETEVLLAQQEWLYCSSPVSNGTVPYKTFQFQKFRHSLPSYFTFSIRIKIVNKA